MQIKMIINGANTDIWASHQCTSSVQSSSVSTSASYYCAETTEKQYQKKGEDKLKKHSL